MPRGSSKKLKVELPPVEDLEEDWESSQAEEEEMEDWDSTQAEDSLQDSLEDEEEAEEVEEVAAAARPSSSAEKASSTDTISAPGRGPARPHSRWDETGRFPNPTTQTAPTTSKKRQKKTKPAARKSTAAAAAGGLRIAANEPAQTRELRNRIFPTLYAIFQQSRGQEQELKVKNRSLRSLTRSCLYHKSEDQLQRTLEDAEALFNKYCALTLKE
ncbi:L4 33 kDa protein [Human mastadenovirus E]|uniref:L4 33 kDa protein n=2 Tax=Human mastadenovirus E TaxID=130308 RepID=Q4JES6_ADE04|nr:33K [Human mastadenovirus E]AAS66929.1 33K [Human mastadenovirus E]AAT97503.1 L4 33 kDa protein [Human adenovirus E4]AVQ69376.1 L4 33 kDa protein [Human mastadenovirus E]QOX73573.1 L4 33 kDa protein [Human adenovirus E4]